MQVFSRFFAIVALLGSVATLLSGCSMVVGPDLIGSEGYVYNADVYTWRVEILRGEYDEVVYDREWPPRWSDKLVLSEGRYKYRLTRSRISNHGLNGGISIPSVQAERVFSIEGEDYQYAWVIGVDRNGVPDIRTQ